MATTLWRDIPIEQAEYNDLQDVLVRQSLIGQMQLCEYRVKLDGQEGFLQAVSEPLVFGTCVHHLIAQDLIAGETRLDLLTSMDEWVEAILVEGYDWTLSKVPNPRDFFAELTTAYRTWRTDVRPRLGEAVSIEKELFLQIGEGEKRNYFLKGTPDYVEETVIHDWKTSGRDWKDGKADLSIQSSLYMALNKQDTGQAVQKFVFWVFQKSRRDWTAIRTSRKVREIDAALISAHDYARKLEAGLYAATPVVEEYGKKKRGWYCSPKFCEAWNICPVKFLNDDVNEKEIAIRSW